MIGFNYLRNLHSNILAIYQVVVISYLGVNGEMSWHHYHENLYSKRKIRDQFVAFENNRLKLSGK